MSTSQGRRLTKETERLVNLPPVVGALLSAILPGLGQILAGYIYRGILILAVFATTIPLWFWRIHIAARRIGEGWVKIERATRVQPFLIVLAAGIILLYLLTIFDAYQSFVQKRRNAILLFTLIVLLFLGLGWQIGEIDLFRMVTGIEEGSQKLLQVMWPWERAVTREELRVQASAPIAVPCIGEPSPPNTPKEDEPYLIADPTCGLLSEQDGAQGTTLHLVGGNFTPGERIDFWWADPLRQEFRQRQAGEFFNILADENGGFDVEIIMPYRLVPPSVSEEAQTWTIIARQISGYGPSQPSEELLLAIEKMVETIFLGMIATFFGIILAIPVSFFAARNLMSASWITLAFYFLTRTVLNIVRSIEPIIWTVIAVVVVGLGPFPGILALTLHTIAALGKLYSESIESIDPGPIEAIQATGANWVQTVIYAVIPQIIPPFVSFTIYRWDINVRMSTVIGLVGGGGIGFLLIQWIRLLDYSAAGIAVWFIAITVAVLDYVSSEIRQRFV
jgi:phosphonate transport system permease protein